MLPLSPPRTSRPPAYPTRAGLLGDAGLRRQVLGALAAAALAGCGGDAVPQPPPGAPPAAGTPTAQPLRGEPAAAPATPQPQRLAGDVVAPQPATITPVAPEPQPLGGKPAPATVPQPQRLGGAMPAPPPPPPPPPAPAAP